jgi:hypothetical protein
MRGEGVVDGLAFSVGEGQEKGHTISLRAGSPNERIGFY